MEDDDEHLKPPAVVEISLEEKKMNIDGNGIANLLRDQGPVVKCVVLRAPKRDAKKPADSGSDNLDDLIEELEIDTTPQKNEVEGILGGPITFIGQYDEGEGIVLMAVRGLVEEVEDKDFANMTISQLRAQCLECDINMDNMVEKGDLVDALKEKERSLPLLNPHKLQPPLDNIRVRGDILILKVAEVEDDSVDVVLESEEEEEGNLGDNGNTEEKEEVVGKEKKEEELDDGKAKENTGNSSNKGEAPVPANGTAAAAAASNEPEPASTDFFLPYTKEEYLKFAARTDIVTLKSNPKTKSSNDDNELEYDSLDEHDENDEDFHPGEEELTEEEEKSAMLNIVMSELLRKFRSDNERGPDSQEVLEIRASVAEQIGMEVLTYDETQEVAEQAQVNGKKRTADDTGDDEPRKRVKFDSNLVSEEPEPGDDNERKQAAESSAAESQPAATVNQKTEDQGSKVSA